MVELRSRQVVVVPQGRISGCLHLALERVMNRLKFLGSLVIRVVIVEEVVGFGAAIRHGLEHVIRKKAESLSEMEDGLVVRVDEFSAVLADLALEVVVTARDERAVRMHPAADSGR